MLTIKKKSNCPDVATLQNMLYELNYIKSKYVTGVFDEITENALRLFQLHNGLKSDGICGARTWELYPIKNKLIAKEEYEQIEKEYGVPLELILTVARVESSGCGWLADGRPKILFEGHIFYNELKNNSIDADVYCQTFPEIVYPTWTKAYYSNDQYKRLELAKTIDSDSAVMATSWGRFQIMGFNYKSCGYEYLWQFKADANKDDYSQLKMFINFLKYTNLLPLLMDHRWQEFARRYNGEGYENNQYDKKLECEYNIVSDFLKE